MLEPDTKRVIAFVDGQNLFYSVRDSFGYTYPNYDILALAKKICVSKNWTLSKVQFYTGVPDAVDDEFWNHFWTHKLAMLGRQGVKAFSRPLRYRQRTITQPDGKEITVRTGVEKGIDVRIAIDIIRLAHANEYDVALVFSQDQDLSEVSEEIRAISKEQGRWIKIASSYPHSDKSSNPKGIAETDWLPISKSIYDECIDQRDYRLRKTRK